MPLLLAAVVIEATIGLRLVMLSRRTRGLAERLWGWAWLLDAISQGGGAVGEAAFEGLWATVNETAMAGLGSTSLACLAVGIWQIFRPEERWLAAVIGAGLFILALTFFVLSFTGGVVSSGTERSAMSWVNRGLGCVLLGWGAMECGLAYQASAKQRRLGLVEPLLVLRFQLWGVSALLILIFLLLLIGRDLLGIPNIVVRTLQPVLAFFSGVGTWITFFPPEWLKRRFDREVVTDGW